MGEGDNSTAPTKYKKNYLLQQAGIATKGIGHVNPVSVFG
jgi:hypothetical protein